LRARPKRPQFRRDVVASAVRVTSDRSFRGAQYNGPYIQPFESGRRSRRPPDRANCPGGPQDLHKMTFQPFAGSKPSDRYEVFAQASPASPHAAERRRRARAAPPRRPTARWTSATARRAESGSSFTAALLPTRSSLHRFLVSVAAPRDARHSGFDHVEVRPRGNPLARRSLAEQSAQ
jgi:hypothetical protein